MKEHIEMKMGFSIELDISKDWRLEFRGTHQGLPLYESIGGEVSAIALVENPAIKERAIAIEEVEQIMGPIMIPNLKIYRNQGPKGHEKCYWYFSEATIAKLQQSFKENAKIGH